jgi:hypothetical protein
MRIIEATAVVAAIAVVGGRVGAADLSGAEIKDMISVKPSTWSAGSGPQAALGKA